MRRTSLVVDDDTLARVQHILGTHGLKDTVDRAFDEVVRAEKRRNLARRLRTGEGIDRSEEIFRAARPLTP